MTKDPYIFPQWINDAMLSVVEKAISTCITQGLVHKHHFYITFFTAHHKVELSDDLRAKYPEFMTIVLENQFENLKLTKYGFDVTLSFNSIPQVIHVPYKAIANFSDPKSNISLSFQYESEQKPKKNSSKLKTKIKKIKTPEMPENVLVFPKKD